jgi:hypothetical protein
MMLSGSLAANNIGEVGLLRRFSFMRPAGWVELVFRLEIDGARSVSLRPTYELPTEKSPVR